VKVEKYVGSIGSMEAGEKAVRMLLEHAEAVKVEVDRRVALCRRAAERMRRT
jgi:hypothetical protein